MEFGVNLNKEKLGKLFDNISESLQRKISEKKYLIELTNDRINDYNSKLIALSLDNNVTYLPRKNESYNLRDGLHLPPNSTDLTKINVNTTNNMAIEAPLSSAEYKPMINNKYNQTLMNEMEYQRRMQERADILYGNNVQYYMKYPKQTYIQESVPEVEVLNSGLYMEGLIGERPIGHYSQWEK